MITSHPEDLPVPYTDRNEFVRDLKQGDFDGTTNDAVEVYNWYTSQRGCSPEDIREGIIMAELEDSAEDVEMSRDQGPVPEWKFEYDGKGVVIDYQCGDALEGEVENGGTISASGDTPLEAVEEFLKKVETESYEPETTLYSRNPNKRGGKTKPQKDTTTNDKKYDRPLKKPKILEGKNKNNEAEQEKSEEPSSTRTQEGNEYRAEDLVEEINEYDDHHNNSILRERLSNIDLVPNSYSRKEIIEAQMNIEEFRHLFSEVENVVEEINLKNAPLSMIDQGSSLTDIMDQIDEHEDLNPEYITEDSDSFDRLPNIQVFDRGAFYELKGSVNYDVDIADDDPFRKDWVSNDEPEFQISAELTAEEIEMVEESVRNEGNDGEETEEELIKES